MATTTTDTQINQLRLASVAAGDDAQVITCLIALDALELDGCSTIQDAYPGMDLTRGQWARVERMTREEARSECARVASVLDMYAALERAEYCLSAIAADGVPEALAEIRAALDKAAQ